MLTMLTTIIWILMICLCQPIKSFDMIETLTYWFLDSTETRFEKSVYNEEAQNKFLKEQEFIRTAIRTVEEDYQKIKTLDTRWKIYGETSNIIMHLVTKWVLRSLDDRGKIKEEELKDLYWRRNYEPFCDENHHRGLYHQEWKSICRRAFANDFFKHKNWQLVRPDELFCARFDIKKIEKNLKLDKYETIAKDRWVRQCFAKDERNKSSFSFYLIAGLSYKPTGGRFSYFVLLERDIREGKHSSNWFGEPKIQVAAFIEK